MIYIISDVEKITKVKMEDVEDTRHLQLMKFMTEFRLSMEEKITNTNEKLDNKLEKITEEVKELSDKVTVNEDANKAVQLIMDRRLQELEQQMRKSNLLRGEREDIRRKEEEREKEQRKEDDRKKESAEKRKFARRVIEQDVLAKETEEEPRQKLGYTSSWAKEMEELADAAGQTRGNMRMRNEDKDKERQSNHGPAEKIVPLALGNPGREFESDLPIWKQARQDPLASRGYLRSGSLPSHSSAKEHNTGDKKKKKILIFKNFFEDETDRSDSESSDDSLDDSCDKWNEVERKKKNALKKKKSIEKKKTRTAEISIKMSHIVGIGPVDKQSLEYFEKTLGGRQEAEKAAAQEYLKYLLDYNEEDLIEAEIADTKVAASGDFIYIAFKSAVHARKVHFRRAASGNDELQVRDYVPPMLHSRYMAIANRAKEVRGEKPQLKTQMRWGEHDIEIYTKERGTKQGYKKTDLKGFMGENFLPDIDLAVKWQLRAPGLSRRKLNFGKTRGELPSRQGGMIAAMQQHQKTTSRIPTLTRKLSLNREEKEPKKQKQNERMETEELEDYNNASWHDSSGEEREVEGGEKEKEEEL